MYVRGLHTPSPDMLRDLPMVRHHGYFAVGVAPGLAVLLEHDIDEPYDITFFRSLVAVLGQDEMGLAERVIARLYERIDASLEPREMDEGSLAVAHTMIARVLEYEQEVIDRHYSDAYSPYPMPLVDGYNVPHSVVIADIGARDYIRVLNDAMDERGLNPAEYQYGVVERARRVLVLVYAVPLVSHVFKSIGHRAIAKYLSKLGYHVDLSIAWEEVEGLEPWGVMSDVRTTLTRIIARSENREITFDESMRVFHSFVRDVLIPVSSRIGRKLMHLLGAALFRGFDKVAEGREALKLARDMLPEREAALLRQGERIPAYA